MTINLNSPPSQKTGNVPTPPVTKKDPVTTEAFLSSVQQLLTEGIQNGYSRDYVSGTIHQFVRENPETARGLNFPAEPSSIRKEIVDSFYDSRKSVGSESKEGEGFGWGETGQCLASESPGLLMDGIKLGIAVSKKNPVGILTWGGTIVKEVAECVQDGFKAKDK